MSNSRHPSSSGLGSDEGHSEPTKARILVVDDDPDIREFLTNALSASGNYDVEVAGNAPEALLAMDDLTGTFDCLLVDIQMPKVNGIDLCAILRQNPEYSSVPILMLTAMSERKYLDSAFSKGATDYITKPFDVVELRMRVDRARRENYGQSHYVEETSPHASVGTAKQSASSLKLDQPILLTGIDRLVHQNSFEDYVMQSSSRDTQNAFIRATKIVNIQRLHRALPEECFRGVLRCVAELISNETMRCGGVLSYKGNGVFLHIGQGKIALDQGISNPQSNRSKYLENIREVSGHNIDLVFGDKMPISGIPKSHIRFELNKAIENVEGRDTRSKKWAANSKWKPEQTSNGKGRNHIELSAYKILLQDMVLQRNCRPN